MYGMEVMRMRVDDVHVLQRQENSAMRRMLGASRSVAVAGMRGDIGIGTMKSRIIRTKLQYRRRVEQGNNELLKKVMKSAIEDGSEWGKEFKKSLEWIGMSEEWLVGATGKDVKRAVADRVHEEWIQEMEERSSLKIYRQFKKEMKEEDFDGGMESSIWFAARTGSMRLACRRWSGENEDCGMCGEGREDEEHFILECGRLEHIRWRVVELQRPRREEQDMTLGLFLFGAGCTVGDRRRVLSDMWSFRERVLNT